LKRLLYLIILSLAALLISVPAASAQDDVTVSIQDFSFNPGQLTVAPGTTVTWVNEGQAPHDVTSTDGKGLASTTLQPGDDYSFTFGADDAGMTYAYQCTIHPEMTGNVTVSGSDEPSTSPSASASASPSPSASASPSASQSALPDTGGGSLPLLAAGALLGLGILALIAVRRRVA